MLDQYVVDKVRQFSAGARHLLRVFHDQLPGAAQHTFGDPVIQQLTEQEAEGTRTMNRFWVTNVRDSDNFSDGLERRCVIDLEVMQEAVEWLKVLAAKLEIGSGRPGVSKPKKRSLTVARIKDRIRALRGDKLSFKAICEILDKERIPRPPGTDWRDLTWSVAYLRFNKSVKSWMSKAANV